MDFTLTFIRGAFTQAGKEGRFLGLADHPPHPDGIALLRDRALQGEYTQAQAVFSSPLARCVESARAIYPYSEIIVAGQLASFDYGAFSGKDYVDIIADKQFEDWAKADQLLALPGGEAPYAFIGRCGEALRTIAAHVQKNKFESVSVVTHQAVISAILQRYSTSHCLYKDYQLDYGGGLTAACKTETMALKVLRMF